MAILNRMLGSKDYTRTRMESETSENTMVVGNEHILGSLDEIPLLGSIPIVGVEHASENILTGSLSGVGA